MDIEDATLNARVIGGDRVAFSLLVRRYERRLRSFLVRVSDTSRADDLAQETFIRAWRRAAQFNGSGSYASWLLRIGWRVFLDDRKRHRTATRSLDHLTNFPIEVQAGTESDRLDLVAALRNLTPVERAVVILCEAQGFTQIEASVTLDLPLGTLKSIALRARRKLQALLQPEDREANHADA